jgi:hypothetical protein
VNVNDAERTTLAIMAGQASCAPKLREDRGGCAADAPPLSINAERWICQAPHWHTSDVATRLATSMTFIDRNECIVPFVLPINGASNLGSRIADAPLVAVHAPSHHQA